MKVFVVGATGVLSGALVPQLVARGHEVVGMTRSASKQDLLRSLGACPVLADALDPDAVTQAVASAGTEVIVHQLTALSGKMSARDMRHPERSSVASMTNRLRTEATDHLLAASRVVGHAASWRRASRLFDGPAQAARCKPRPIPSIREGRRGRPRPGGYLQHCR